MNSNSNSITYNDTFLGEQGFTVLANKLKLNLNQLNELMGKRKMICIELSIRCMRQNPFIPSKEQIQFIMNRLILLWYPDATPENIEFWIAWNKSIEKKVLQKDVNVAVNCVSKFAQTTFLSNFLYRCFANVFWFYRSEFYSKFIMSIVLKL